MVPNPPRRISTFRMTKLEHSGNMSALTIRTTRMPSVHPCLSSYELVQLHTAGISAVLPTKRRCDEREPLRRQRGGEELLPNGSWNSGANRRTVGASHVASHRGLAGRKGVPTFWSRSCCNASTSQDTLSRPRGLLSILTRILLKRLWRANTLSCRGPLAPRSTRRRTGQWKEKSPVPDPLDQCPDAPRKK